MRPGAVFSGDEALSSSLLIRGVRNTDAQALCAIYNHYVEHSIATFEEESLSVAEMQRRIDALAQHHPWLCAEHQGALAGYAYAAPWKERSAYRLSVECSVYVAPAQRSKGFGAALLEALLKALETTKLHAVIAGISLPNAASIALHERFGFREAGRLRQVGYKFGRYVDVGYWQKLLH